MAWEITEWADKAMLMWLHEQFQAAAEKKPSLFHVTRTSIVPDQDPCEGLEQGWDEFLPGQRFFAFAAYHRPVSGVQHCCYFGVEDQLQHFSELAKLARGLAPGNLLRLGRIGDYQVVARDTWMLMVYQIALRDGYRIPINRDGNGAFASAELQFWPGPLAVNIFEDIAGQRESLLRWQSQTATKLGFQPRYLYAALEQDVFSSSALAIDYLIQHADTLYGSYEDPGLVPPSAEAPGVVPSPFHSGTQQSFPAPQGLPHSRTDPASPNDERDAWMYDLYCRGSTLKQIRAELGRLRKEKEWVAITSDQGVRQAILRYADRKGLEPPPSRRQK